VLIFTFSLQRFLLDPPPVVRRLFEVNSEPHTGARPSVRLCVGLKRNEHYCDLFMRIFIMALWLTYGL
jgi:hypothetical protein